MKKFLNELSVISGADTPVTKPAPIQNSNPGRGRYNVWGLSRLEWVWLGSIAFVLTAVLTLLFADLAYQYFKRTNSICGFTCRQNVAELESQYILHHRKSSRVCFDQLQICLDDY